MKDIREQILEILKANHYYKLGDLPMLAITVLKIESLIKKKCRDKYNKGFADGQRVESNFLNRTNI